MRSLFKATFGITLGGRRIAVDRAEIALTIDQWQSQRPVLRHTRQGVVNRRVAVRVIFTHHVAGHAGRFYVFLVPVDTHLVHREKDTPVHRLQSVTDVGKRAGHDDAHGVIEIGPLHLFHDGNGFDAWRQLSAAGCALLSQIGSRSLFGIS